MEFEPLVVEDGNLVDIDEILPKPSPASRHRTSRWRYLGLFLVGVLVLSVVMVSKVRSVHKRFEDLQDTYANGVIGLNKELPHNALSRGCKAGSVCMCDNSVTVDGCYSWNYQVGDVFIFDVGPGATPENIVENAAMMAIYEGAVHASTVTEVNGPMDKNLTNVIITEALKGSTMKVVQNTLGDILRGRIYRSLWIKRVDKSRFQKFDSHAETIKQWGRNHKGEPFDQELMLQKAIPFPWRWIAPNWIEALPGCDGRKKALDLYHAGGPRKWFCSQLVSWTLAFAGGLNTDYGDAGDCVTPPWDGHIEYLQMAPGDLLNQPFWDPASLHIPCPSGCTVDLV
jgi:hypothetical protein